MTVAHVNDFIITQSTGLLQVDATGSSKVSLSVVTQISAGGLTNLKAKLQGSNDQGYWHDLTANTDVGSIGSYPVTGDVKGFLWVRGYFTYTAGSPPLISASINTGN